MMPADSLVLTPGLKARIFAHALAGYPQEVCGLVAGRRDRGLLVYPGRNVSATPLMAFELDTDTLAQQIDFEDQGLELIATYHSHPHGPAAPSPADVQQSCYLDAVLLICSLADRLRPVLRGFRIAQGSFREVMLLCTSR